MNKNEMTVTQEQQFNLQVLQLDAEALAEEMDGLGPIPYEKVKIPSGGGLAFEVPTDDEDNPDMVKELKGIILYHHPINAFWQNKYDGQNSNPDCASYDGKVGVVTATGECIDCSRCPHNQFGSDTNGRGKACKNMHRCYVLMEGNPVPIILTLPPSSIKGLRDYLGKKVVMKGMRSYEVITKISLKKEQSGDGITYSRAVFNFAGKLEGDMLGTVREMAESIKKANTNIDITAEDYDMPPQNTAPTDDGNFHPVTEADVPEFSNPNQEQLDFETVN